MTAASTKYACGVEYLGSHYKGWQSQDNQETIQDQIEKALSSVATKTYEYIQRAEQILGSMHSVRFFTFHQTPIEPIVNGWMASIPIYPLILEFSGSKLSMRNLTQGIQLFQGHMFISSITMNSMYSVIKEFFMSEKSSTRN